MFKKSIIFLFIIVLILSLKSLIVFTDVKGVDNFSDIKLVSEREYLEAISKAKNMSLKEAKKYVDDVIEKHMQNKAKNYSKDGQRPMLDKKYYYYVIIRAKQKVAPGVVIEIGVPGILYSQGTFREFVSIEEQKAYTDIVSYDIHQWKEFYVYAEKISGARVVLRGRGCVEISEPYAILHGINLKFWTYSNTINHAKYYRKTVNLFHEESLY
ncbi:hypothetical protein [Caloranaerobacter sp. DY30410]|uniref:hypothetical protein n=1 Tax=Caloranaerobacter sp. DY30410 TaxID=3238305 RepID=UPI003CFE7718